MAETIVCPRYDPREKRRSFLVHHTRLAPRTFCAECNFEVVAARNAWGLAWRKLREGEEIVFICEERELAKNSK